MLKNLLRNRRVLALLALTTAVIAFSSVAAFAATTSVKVGDKWFRARTVTIHKGGKVTWTWVGHLYHNVTVKSGPVKFHSRIQAHGTYSHIFTRAGTYHLYCSIHPGMTMTVYVK